MNIDYSQYKLTIELVPKSCWYSNVRSNVRTSEWDVIRKKCYENANNKCEICSSTGLEQGYNYSVECHEIWKYNDDNHLQILIGVIALCPYCHKTKHVGLAQIKNEEDIVIKQLMTVNNISRNDAKNYIQNSFNIWRERIIISRNMAIDAGDLSLDGQEWIW
jgi:hypothetical protein